MMLAKVDEGEVKAILFHMHLDKSPGPDGMTPDFYQKCWDIVKLDIVRTVQQFFATGKIDVELRSTNIALIPKN